MSDFEIVVIGFTFIVGLIAAFGLGVIAGCVRWDKQRKQLKETREELAAERALVARITGGTDDILRAAKGAHHRTEKEADRG